EEVVMLRRSVLSGCDNKSPGLFIIRGWRPAGRFKQAFQFLRFDRPLVERARTPATGDQVLNGIRRLSRFLHTVQPSFFSLLCSISGDHPPPSVYIAEKPRPDGVAASRSLLIRPQKDCVGRQARRDNSPDRLYSAIRPDAAPIATR